MNALLNAVMPTPSALPEDMRALEKGLRRHLRRDRIQAIVMAYEGGFVRPGG